MRGLEGLILREQDTSAAKEVLLRVAGHPLEEISEKAMSVALSMWSRDPNFAWAALRLGATLSLGSRSVRPVAYGYDPDNGNVCVGRFGWKAAKCTLRHQVAGALMTDMSVTSSLYPNRECLFGPQNCNTTFRVDKGIPEKDLVRVCYGEVQKMYTHVHPMYSVDPNDPLFEDKNVVKAYRNLMEKL